MENNNTVTLGGHGFIMLDKELAENIGIIPSIIFGELVSTFNYWKDKNKLSEKDGKDWFFCTIEDMQNKTTIKKDAQSSAIKALEEAGLIVTKLFGLPAKRYFHLAEEAVSKFIEQHFTKTNSAPEKIEKEVENTEEARTYQVSEKPKARIRENSKQGFVESATNNKALNNNLINKELERENTHATFSLNSAVKEFMKTNESVFHNKNINLEEVYKWLSDNHIQYTDKQLIVGLNQVLRQKQRIFSPYGFLNSTFDRIDIFIELQEKTKKYKKSNRGNFRSRSRKPSSSETTPSWFNNNKNKWDEKDKDGVNTEEISLSLEAERQALLKELGVIQDVS